MNLFPKIVIVTKTQNRMQAVWNPEGLPSGAANPAIKERKMKSKRTKHHWSTSERAGDVTPPPLNGDTSDQTTKINKWVLLVHCRSSMSFTTALMSINKNRAPGSGTQRLRRGSTQRLTQSHTLTPPESNTKPDITDLTL